MKRQHGAALPFIGPQVNVNTHNARIAIQIRHV